MKQTLRSIVLSGTIFLITCSFVVPGDGKKAEKGTYQIVISDNKRQYAFTDALLVTIEEKREEHKSIIYPLSPMVNIIIPSRDEISSKTFKPLEEVRYQ
jgi:hypothetical protein